MIENVAVLEEKILLNAKEVIKHAKHAAWMQDKEWAAYWEEESRNNQCPDCKDKDIEIRILNSILGNVTCGLCPHFKTVRYRSPCGPNDGYCTLHRKLGTLSSDSVSCRGEF